MRRILPFAIIFAALSLSTTGVRADGTWCAHYGTGLEGMNCGFYSFEQCRVTVSGVGDFAKHLRGPKAQLDEIAPTVSRARVRCKDR